MLLLAIGFPLSLWAWSSWHFQTWEPGSSISGYYHAETEWVRDHFVGVLSAIGICLIAYHGFTGWENRLLNIAGLAVIGVAMFPTGIEQAPRMTLSESSAARQTDSLQADPLQLDPLQLISPHGVCAGLFFLCLAAVALTQSEHSLRLIEDESVRRRFSRTYRVIGVLMVCLPAAAWATLWLAKRHWGIFAVEALGVLTFAGYWFTKTLEFRGTNGEPEAILLGSAADEAS